ncbi:10585_t:CDS:2, partial [Paraglomus occultum]
GWDSEEQLLLCGFARMMEQSFVFNPHHYQNNLKRFTERDLELLKQMPSDTSPSLTREK